MSISQAARLYLLHVHQGVVPTMRELSALGSACLVLKDAGIDRMDVQKLLVVAKEQA